MTNAMRRFAGWVSARPHRLIALAAFCMYGLLPVSSLSVALIVLATLRGGPAAGFASAGLASLGAGLIATVARAPLLGSLSVIAPILFASAASGALLYWSRSLSLAFQGTTIGAVVLVFLIFLLVPQASQIGVDLRDEVVATLDTWGATPEQMEIWSSIDPAGIVWLLLIGLTSFYLAALVLGFWWHGLLSETVDVGRQFRSLKLGRFAGIILMILVTSNYVVESAMLQYLSAVAVVGFLFQGLAVLHARCRSDKWPNFVLVIIYVFLFSPLTLIAVMGLSAVGLLDNFFALRQRAPQNG